MSLFSESEDGKMRFEKNILPRMTESALGIAETYGEWIDTPLNNATFTLFLPMYRGVRDLQIGIPRDAILSSPAAYTHQAPIVFYGSSITQGACASAPVNAYTNQISIQLHADIRNLGFSGSARGEPAMARYIASLSMSMLCMDYDHNAPTPAYLSATHKPFFRIVRERRPELPILLLSRPGSGRNSSDTDERFEIIRATYEEARNRGDQNVYLLDGRRFFDGSMREACTIDGIHPNDLGFSRMTDAILPVIQHALS